MLQGISLIVPVFNESKSINELIETITLQTVQPDEVIIVDGGSTDDTASKIATLTSHDPRFKLITAGRAMPGRGRNIGIAEAGFDWLAFTDAGIKLDKDWLEKLIEARNNTGADIIYGNFDPITENLFEKCAAISYVPGKPVKGIRGKTIVSCLIRKEICEKIGGFPDLRATEDLIFIENAEKSGSKIGYAPEAFAKWKLRPNLISTYRKFQLYSMYNVWAGRQAYWHYGLARQYAMVILVLLLAIFHHPLWLLLIPAWMIARAAKRIFLHRFQFGWQTLFNPIVYLGVILITLTIDFASFAGWIMAIAKKPSSIPSDE